MNTKQMNDILEVIADKQNSNPEIRLLIDGLLFSPWRCSDKLINKYVTKSLAKILKKYKRSVLYYIFQKNNNYWFSSYITDNNIYLYDKATNEAVAFSSQLELYKEIITEDLEKESIHFDLFSTEVQKVSIGLYLYATIAIYDVVGITEIHPDFSEKYPYFLIKPYYLDAYLLKQFRTYSNEHSRISDYLYLVHVFQTIPQKYIVKNSEELKRITNHLIDKNLSINVRYLKKPLSPTFQQLFERGQLLAYLFLYLCQLYLDKSRTDKSFILILTSEIMNAGFGQQEIESLIDDKENRVGFYDSILEKTGVNSTLKLKNFSLKYALKIHMKNLLDNALRTQEKWFETSYLIPYLKNELNPKRFIIGNGFQRKNKYKDVLPRYDIDAVIYDKKTDIFYFCQLKHRLDFVMTSFRDEVRNFNSEKIQDGVNQLRGLKEIINQDLIKRQIITAFQDTSLNKSTITKSDLLKNGRFLLLHNIADFDFCSSQEIIMYEWNTFRNLLKGSISITRTKDNETAFSVRNKELILDFANLISVKENSLMNITDDSSFKISKEYLQITIYSRSKLVFLNKKFYLFKDKLECLAPYFN